MGGGENRKVLKVKDGRNENCFGKLNAFVNKGAGTGLFSELLLYGKPEDFLLLCKLCEYYGCCGDGRYNDATGYVIELFHI